MQDKKKFLSVTSFLVFIIAQIEANNVCPSFLIVNAADLPGIKILIKELDDVLFRDVGDKIAADGR